MNGLDLAVELSQDVVLILVLLHFFVLFGNRQDLLSGDVRYRGN